MPNTNNLKIVTVEQIKAHLRIDVADTQEEQELVLIAEGVEQQAFQVMERSYDSLIVEFGTVPADIKLAILGRITTNYQNRSDERESKRGTTITIAPRSWDAILIKYKPACKV